MKEFIEKLIGRLEEINHTDYGSIGSYESHVAVRDCLRDVKNIVNQLAEEYEECFNLCSENCEVYDKEKHYCPKWCEVIKGTIAEMEENYRLVLCNEYLPDDGEIHEVTAQFSNGMVYTEFAYYDVARDEWWKYDNSGLVGVIAWRRHATPYQPKGENNGI